MELLKELRLTRLLLKPKLKKNKELQVLRELILLLLFLKMVSKLVPKNRRPTNKKLTNKE